MKQFYIQLTIIIFLFNVNKINAQQVWTGPTTVFTKPDSAIWTLEENQDRITDSVWITRADQGGLFNVISESESGFTGYSSNPVPSNTEWAYGTTANYNTLTYQNLNALIGENFKNIVDGQNMVLHLISDDIYIDIKFLSWSKGYEGGGFSYERSTNQSSSTSDFEKENNVKLFPNPSSDFINISGLEFDQNYTIIDILGSEKQNGTIFSNENIDIKSLTDGLYLLKFDNGNTIKFTKK